MSGPSVFRCVPAESSKGKADSLPRCGHAPSLDEVPEGCLYGASGGIAVWDRTAGPKPVLIGFVLRLAGTAGRAVLQLDGAGDMVLYTRHPIFTVSDCVAYLVAQHRADARAGGAA